MPNCPECTNREIQKKRKQLEEEAEVAYEEGKDVRVPTYREMEEEIDFPIEGLVPDNKPPGLLKDKVNRSNVIRRDDDDVKDVTIGIQKKLISCRIWF